MPRDEWYRADEHPAACTCVSCNEKRLRRLRGGRRSTGILDSGPPPKYSSAQRYDVKSGSGIPFKKISIYLLIVSIGALIGLIALHMSRGAETSEAVYMMIEDVRVAATCPGNGAIVWIFIMRPDSASMAAGKSGNLGTRIIEEICQDRLPLARSLAEPPSAGNPKLTSQRFSALDRQPPTIPPTAIAIDYTPTPRIPASQTPIVIVSGETSLESTPMPTMTSEINSRGDLKKEIDSTTNAASGNFFKSFGDLTKSAGNRQPEISISELELQIHDLINVQRVESNLKPLAFDKDLVTISRRHSIDMATNDYMSHENLAGQDASDRGADVGYDCIKRYSDHYTFGLAENIHQGWLFSSVTYINGVPIRDWNSQKDIGLIAVSGWMNSPGHRANILTDTYDRAGVGVAVAADGKVFITQDFC